MKKYAKIDEKDFSLLKTAVFLLKKEKISDDMWCWGGGTALKLFFRHRDSRDVDIFVRDPQIIPYLSPRVNDYAEEVCSGNYVEMSNFLKLKIQGREIDFIVAPNLTGLLPERIKVKNLIVPVDHPIETITKKFFYRAESLTVRDLVDYAVVRKNLKDKKAWEKFFQTLKSKKDVLTDKVLFLMKILPEELPKLKILDEKILTFVEKEGKELLNHFKDDQNSAYVKKNAKTKFNDLR